MELQTHSCLLHIDAAHFNAGAIVKLGFVRKAAPIIRYMEGWNLTKVYSYCKKKEWHLLETDIYYTNEEKLIEF